MYVAIVIARVVRRQSMKLCSTVLMVFPFFSVGEEERRGGGGERKGEKEGSRRFRSPPLRSALQLGLYSPLLVSPSQLGFHFSLNIAQTKNTNL